MIDNKNLNPIISELFNTGRKISICLVFSTQSYFKVPKDVTLNSTHFFIMKFEIKENFNKFHETIHQILTLKIL